MLGHIILHLHYWSFWNVSLNIVKVKCKMAELIIVKISITPDVDLQIDSIYPWRGGGGKHTWSQRQMFELPVCDSVSAWKQDQKIP